MLSVSGLNVSVRALCVVLGMPASKAANRLRMQNTRSAKVLHMMPERETVMTIKQMRSVLTLMKIAILAMAATCAGCASPAQPRAMVPASFDLMQRHSNRVSLAVSGGQKTNPMWTSQIANEDFSEAIVEAITQSRLFTAVVTDGSADYKLDVFLKDLVQPLVGFDMTATAVVQWRLTHVRSEKVLFDETVTTPYTASVGDAFVGVKRLRLANEGAARENIKDAFRRLAKVRLD